MILVAMTARFAPGDFVHTPLGKGLVLEVRNRTVLVRVQARAVLLDAGDITAGAAASATRATAPKNAPAHEATVSAAVSARRASVRRNASARAAGPAAGRARDPACATLDVHGLTVDQALDAIDAALSDAMLRDVDQLRVIHGRSSGRIRDALHRHLRGLPAVRKAHLDPANAGVTIIVLA